MLIVWDESKRQLNLAVHGLDFADFEAGFDFDTAIRAVTYPSRATGRERFALIGWFEGELVTVGIVSPLGSEALSLVSLRPASRKERATYGF